MKTGELSRLTGMSIAMLHYYEVEGLSQCLRTESNKREFPETAVKTVQRILHLRSLKIPIKEIKKILGGFPHPSVGSSVNLEELQARLEYVLTQKAVWEQQEHEIRLQIEAWQGS